MLGFSRALGEYGSVVFISGNMPLRTEIVPLLIVTKLEQYDYAGATALAVVMLVASFLLLLLINLMPETSEEAYALIPSLKRKDAPPRAELDAPLCHSQHHHDMRKHALHTFMCICFMARR